MPPRRARPLFALAATAAVLAVAGAASPGTADARDGDRVEVRVVGTCGGASAIRLRLRAEEGRIRVDTQVRTRRAGVWRLTVLHERRAVVRPRIRVARRDGGFSHRVTVPAGSGADAVAVRAVSPAGETCTAAATVAGS